MARLVFSKDKQTRYQNDKYAVTYTHDAKKVRKSEEICLAVLLNLS